MKKKEANQSGGMTPREIRAALMLAGMRVTEIAAFLRVHWTLVSQVISGKRRTTRVQEAIAVALGKPVTSVFGAATPTKRAAKVALRG